MFTDPVVSTHNRAHLVEKRQNLGSESAYLDWIWETRDAERRGMVPLDQARTTVRGAWPYGSETMPPVVVHIQAGALVP